MTETERVTPVMVEGTNLAHLATTTVDDEGTNYRAICPAGALITRPLALIPEDQLFVWCPSCREWADAAEITLPRSR